MNELTKPTDMPPGSTETKQFRRTIDPNAPFQVLLVEDDPSDALTLHQILSSIKSPQCELAPVSSLAQANEKLQTKTFDVVLTALALADSQGLDTYVKLRTAAKEVPVIVLTSAEEESLGVKAVQSGAMDYLVKTNLNPALLERAMRYAIERRHLENQLRQAHRLGTIGQLAGAVAHDFNNLLMVIQGYARVLSTAGGETSQPANEILNAAVRAETLTRELLAISRQHVIHLKDVNLNDIVDEASRMLKRALPENIDLQVQHQTNLPLVHADADMIEQMILSLAVNSRDAMPSGGKLVLSSGSETISASDPKKKPDAPAGEFVCIAVADTGTGIAPEILPRIFEPFFTTKNAAESVGLGLATVSDIVNQHKGWIDVTSNVGQGTTFRIYFPVIKDAAAPAPIQPAAPRAEIPRGTETILVVEDEFHIRSLVTSILRRFGYNVIEAGHGPEAYEVWEKNRDKIQLLLTDMMMPGGVTGGQVADRLKKDKPDLKVVLTSGYSPDIFGEGASPLKPGQIFLQKPYSPDTLLRLVRDTLDAR